MAKLRNSTREMFRNEGYSDSEIEDLSKFRDEFSAVTSTKPSWENTVKLYKKFEGNAEIASGYYDSILSSSKRIGRVVYGRNIVNLIIAKPLHELEREPYVQDYDTAQEIEGVEREIFWEEKIAAQQPLNKG